MKTSKFLVGAVLLAAIATTGTVSGQTAHKYQGSFVQYAGVQAVTGRESAFAEFLKKQLPAGVSAEVDNMGTLSVKFGTGEPQLLVVTSIDEPGYVVTDVTDDGYLRVETPAGRGASTLFHQFHEGHYVDISAAGGAIRGVVAIPSSHISRGKRENLTTDRFLIDIGARSRAEALARGVQVLDPAAAVKDIASLADGRVAGPMLSRKFGAFALMEALKGCNPKQARGVVFAWATQGAMRNSGVARLARRYSPKQVVVVASFRRGEERGARTARSPVEALDSGVLVPDRESPGGSSPLLGALSAKNVKTAESVTGALPETRAFGQGAVDLLPLGIAVKYPDSLVEVIDLDDLEQLVAAIRLLAGM